MWLKEYNIDDFKFILNYRVQLFMFIVGFISYMIFRIGQWLLQLDSMSWSEQETTAAGHLKGLQVENELKK